MHRGKFAFVREQSRQNQSLIHLEHATLPRQLRYLEDDSNESAIKWQSFFDDLRDGVFLRSLITLEPPNFAIRFGQVFIRIPIAILQRLDSSVFLETHASFCQGCIYLIWKIHVLFGSFLQICMLLMPLTDHVWILLEVFGFVSNVSIRF